MRKSTTNGVELQGTAANGSEKAGNGSLALSGSGSGGGKRQRRGIRLKEEPTTTPPETPESEPIPLEGSTDFEAVAVGCAVSLPAPVFDLGGGLQGRSNPALAEASARVLMLGASETLVAAVSYAAMGLRCFPLAVGSKVPPAGFSWSALASSDPHTLAGWFDDGEFFGRGKYVMGNIAIATGATDADYDLVVLDVDVKGGKDGSKVLNALIGELGALSKTLMALTPSGGLHYLFKVPKDSGIGTHTGIFKMYGDGLDIRGIGGYIVVSPSVVGGKPYRWLNDVLPAELPDVWVKALQAECPAGGKRGAVSGSSNGDRVQVVRGELLPMPEDVKAALEEHAVPSSVGRTDWLKVLSVASALEGGEALARNWSSTGAYAGRFNAADFDHAWEEVHGGFNEGAPMPVGTLFNLVKAHSPEWQTPAQRRAAQAKADQEQAEKAARLESLLPGVPMPAYIPRNETPTPPVEVVSDDQALAVLAWITAKGEEAYARVQAGENVGHDAEWLFIVGMLTMNPELVKYQVEHNPIPKGRSSPYQTSKGAIRAVIKRTDGGKPQTPDAVDMSRFTPDWAGGTADAATRFANRIMLARDATLGDKPTSEEAALVQRAFELSPLGKWWTERKEGGLNLNGAVSNGLSRAKRYNTNTHAAVSGSGSGLNFDAANTLPPGAGLRKLSWIDKELTNVGAVGGLAEFCTSDQIEGLLAAYGCTAVFDEMRGKLAVHGLPKRYAQIDRIVQSIRELAVRHGMDWRKADVVDALKLLAEGTRYHPALEWVQRIPWDGQDRFEALLATVEPEDGYHDLWRIGLHRWCMGAIRCLVQPEGMRGVPTIVFYAPAGGEGKDMWQSSLCPIEFQARPNGFDPGNLNWMLAALNGWIGIFPEITTQSRKADIEHVKAFLTADKDTYTSKYEMDVNDRLRRTVYMASTNESDYLADRTGTNRRFITVAVKSINRRHSIDMQQFWAQMLRTFETAWAAGEEQTHRYWLEGDESQLLAEVNESHVVADLMEDQIRARWDFEDEAWLRDKRRTDWAISVQAVARVLDPDSAMNASNLPQMFMKRIAREMSRLGVIKKLMRGKDGRTNYYLLPPPKPMTMVART